MGIVIGYFGVISAVLIFCPLMMLWFMIWDEKKFRQAERKRNRHYYHDHDFYRYEP
jgi:hypothetical protein